MGKTTREAPSRQEVFAAIARVIHLAHVAFREPHPDDPQRDIAQTLRAFVDVLAKYEDGTEDLGPRVIAALLVPEVTHIGILVGIGPKAARMRAKLEAEARLRGQEPWEITVPSDEWAYDRLKWLLGYAGLPCTDEELAKRCKLAPRQEMADDEKRAYLERLPYRILDIIRAGSPREDSWITSEERRRGESKPRGARDRLSPKMGKRHKPLSANGHKPLSAEGPKTLSAEGRKTLSARGQKDRVEHFLAAVAKCSHGSLKNAASVIREGSRGEASDPDDASGIGPTKNMGALKVQGDLKEVLGAVPFPSTREALVETLVDLLGYDASVQSKVADVLRFHERERERNLRVVVVSVD